MIERSIAALCAAIFGPEGVDRPVVGDCAPMVEVLLVELDEQSPNPPIKPMIHPNPVEVGLVATEVVGGGDACSEDELVVGWLGGEGSVSRIRFCFRMRSADADGDHPGASYQSEKRTMRSRLRSCSRGSRSYVRISLMSKTLFWSLPRH